MQSQLTVRIPEELKEAITNLAKRYRLKRSDIVRMALERFIEESQIKNLERPYNAVKDLLGSVSTGVPDLGESHREYLLKKFKKNA